MFSFDNAEITESPVFTSIKPQVNGTSGIYLRKFSWEKPSGKTPRLELTLERKYKNDAGEDVSETSIIMFNDPTQLQSGGENRQKINLEQYGRIILAYRPDLNLESLKKAVGRAETWEEFTRKTFALLPQGFDQKVSTWKLIYFKGQGPMTIDTKYVVKLGAHSFPWNSTFDHVVESEESRNSRSNNRGGGNAAPDNESEYNAGLTGGTGSANGAPSDDDLFN